MPHLLVLGHILIQEVLVDSKVTKLYSLNFQMEENYDKWRELQGNLMRQELRKQAEIHGHRHGKVRNQNSTII